MVIWAGLTVTSTLGSLPGRGKDQSPGQAARTPLSFNRPPPSCSTRRRTACTPSRPSWSPRLGTCDEDRRRARRERAQSDDRDRGRSRPADRPRPRAGCRSCRPPRVSRLPQPAVGTARPDELGVGAALYPVPTRGQAGIPESTGPRSRDLGHLPAEGPNMRRALRP